MRGAIVIAGLAVLTACSGKGGEQAEAGPSTAATSLFQSEIAPVLAGNCATCHLTGAEAGNMSLVPAKAIENLVGVSVKEAPGLVRVVPGKPDESYLIMKLEGTQIAHGGTGVRMPFGGAPLAPEKIAKFRQWIAEGAKP